MNDIINPLKEIFPAHTHQRIFLVGGAVRDILLDRERTDIDLAAALATDEYIALGFRRVEGKSTTVIWHRHVAGLGTIEVTPLASVEDLTQDLGLRDFTINAMAISLAGDLIDPLDASFDLKLKQLRPCSRRTFIDDPLRIFRAFRFSADGWDMTPECVKLVRERDWSAELAPVPVERFSREMLTALEKSEPERFFQLMLDFNVGHGYLPELFRMQHIPAGPLIHHPEGDLFSHSIQVLQRVSAASSDTLARFCGLFHDIGKLATSPALYPKHHGHDQSGFGMSLEFCRRLRLPSIYGQALAWVSRLHGTFNQWDQLRDSTKVRLAGQAIKYGIADILPLVSAADKAGGDEPGEWRQALRIAGMTTGGLGIDPQTLERIPPPQRSDHIRQKRVEAFRSTLTTSA